LYLTIDPGTSEKVLQWSGAGYRQVKWHSKRWDDQ
jgi:hypothetical protein